MRTLLSRSPWTGSAGVAAALRTETVGGVRMLAAAALALVWANSPWPGGYAELQGTTAGPAAVHLDLTLREWTADGRLAILSPCRCWSATSRSVPTPRVANTRGSRS